MRAPRSRAAQGCGVRAGQPEGPLRGRRRNLAAQLEAAIEGGNLAAYALRLGATGLTFFDDDVTRFSSPHAAGKNVMFLMAFGHPERRR